MRLYLSSYRLGCAEKELLALMGTGRKAAIIANSLDHISPHDIRDYEKNVYDPIKEFSSLDISSEKLDLRNYFGNKDKLKEKLEEYHLVWILGGNVFLLRKAMKLSGFDQVIIEMLNEDKIVYGGFSAAAVVAGPSLKGFEIIDDQSQISEGYPLEIIWDGLNLIDFSIIPHIDSEHPETKLAEKTVEYLKHEGYPFQTLRDGEVFIVRKNSTRSMIKKFTPI